MLTRRLWGIALWILCDTGGSGRVDIVHWHASSKTWGKHTHSAIALKVAVGDGSVDFAMGSDTGGSVRVPASFCGILGLRPTWGRVSLQGACTLAETFDTGERKAVPLTLDPACKGCPADCILIMIY